MYQQRHQQDYVEHFQMHVNHDKSDKQMDDDRQQVDEREDDGYDDDDADDDKDVDEDQQKLVVVVDVE